ncbi:hypothetical protein AB7M49_006605 [Bradyrhizobium elkanii]
MTETIPAGTGRKQRQSRPPRPVPDEGSTKIFSIRLDADLRATLEAAVKQSGRSLGREIQLRLRAAITEEERLADQYGSYREALVWRTVAALMRGTRNPRTPEVEWLDDAPTFDLALSAVYAYLQTIRPKQRPGQRAITKKEQAGATILGAKLAVAIGRADPSLPLADRGLQAVANRMKNRFPELANRAEEHFPALFGSRDAKSAKKPRKLKATL